MDISRSQSLFQEAQQYIPGGVNSPVRAFKSVGGNPIFIRRAKGAWLEDENGNKYIDMINSWGPMILGHGHPEIEAAAIQAFKDSSSFGTPTEIEVEMAKLICSMVPSVEKVRMVNSGTEATMSAIRLARGYTGRDKIIKFAGCYHGHGDSFLIAAGSGAMTFGVPDSAGVTKGVAEDTLTATFNDLENVTSLVEANPDSIACIILEPVTGNMGVIIPDDGFLQGLRDLCDAHKILFIYDEVMTGFRLAMGGAQERLGILPDITTLGKIIGGGMPVGAYGGRAEIMDYISPLGPIYQAGTLSGNPVAMHSGYAMLSHLQSHPEIYPALDNSSEALALGLHGLLNAHGIPHSVNYIGSMFTVFFRENPVKNFEDAKSCDTELFGRFFRGMLERGVYLAPSAFEAVFVSTCIGEAEIQHILSAAEETLSSL